MRYIWIPIVLLANQVFAQEAEQHDLLTKIDNVIVYLEGAQISRSGNTYVKRGRSTVIIKSLSPHIDARSIQVKGNGDFTILSVNHNFNYLDELGYDDKVDSLVSIAKKLENEIAKSNSRTSVLKEKQSLLNANKNLGSEGASATISELKEAVDFYDQALMEIMDEELKLKNQINELNLQLSKVRNQIREYQNYEGKPSGEIKIKIESQSNTKARFDVDYLVANAGWFPKYDLRVKDIENPLSLTYKAEVYQNTGVDWNNVRLKFSNGNPNQSGVAPELATWYLNYERNTVYERPDYNMNSFGPGSVSGVVTNEDGEPIPGVNVVISGSSIGTVTDMEGRYSLTLPNDASTLSFSSVGYAQAEVSITGRTHNLTMTPDIMALNEVVVTGYGSGSRKHQSHHADAHLKKEKVAKPITTTKVENQTTVEFEVKTPYSLKSNGENLTVRLKKHDIETIYEYYAVPKLEKDAFLIARIINWDRFGLLEGEANLYFEDAYVGRSILDAKTLADTLNISLGRDKSIVIGRKKSDTFTKRNFIGSNKVETRGFKIMARNKKSQPIHLTIFDQIPVSAISPIEVNVKELSKGTLDEHSGKILWEFDLESQKQVDLTLVYEVRYPKREHVDLE
ncbi:MAG: mucoidy inhibitor MuiA family protein [Cytophagales bacterium]|nr:mucoidy inhibitor MuiA family protein [Cytophagales bacterium]